jgi:hypothetical protein
VNVECRRLIAPNENHNLAGTGWEATRLKWFDHYLRGGAPLPAAPTMSVKTADATATVTVKAPAAKACQLIYSYGTNAATDRCWFGLPMRKTGRGVFAVVLPRREGLDLWYFANCDYRDGVTLSSDYAVMKTETATPSAHPAASRILYDPCADGVYPWYFSWCGPVADHPWHSWGGTTLAVSANVAGRPALHVQSALAGTNGVGAFKAFLRSPACPLRKCDGAKGLSLEVFGERPLRVTVVAYAEGNWSAARNPFQAVVEVTSGQGWAAVDLPVAWFRRKDPTTKRNETMGSFDGVLQFHVTVESADKARGLPALGLIRWTP